jgi:hypothetical protein
MSPPTLLDGAFQDDGSCSKNTGEETLETRLFFNKGDFFF